MNQNTETDDQTTDEQAEADDNAGAPNGPLEPEADDDQDSGNAEAAKYRRRLRDTETERDELADQLTDTRRQLAEHYAERAHVRPAALWSSCTLADLLGDDGQVDPEKVASAAEHARKELGLPRPPAPDPNQGRDQKTAAAPTSWKDVLTGRQ